MLDVTNTSRDLERSDVHTAVLPVGAIEQHGPHLPLSTDWAEVEAVAQGVAERLSAFLVPGVPWGNSQAHVGFRGTISLLPETLGAVVRDIALSLLDQDFQRIVILNGHGGNLILKLAVRDLNLKQSRGKVVLEHIYELGEERQRILGAASDDVHAGESETSLMQHLAPDQVTDERTDHVPDIGQVFFDYLPIKEFCPEGVWGRPSLATPEKGRNLLSAMIRQTAARVEETFARIEALGS